MIIDWIFFDAGNTLIGLDYSLVVRALWEHGFRVDEIHLRRAELTARRDLDRAILERWKQGPLPRTGWVEARVWRNFWRQVLELCGASPAGSEALVETVLEVTRPASSWDRVASSTVPLLEDLSRRGYRLGIISNSNGTLLHQLERLGLAGRFDVIIDSAHAGVEKPHPEIFNIALQKAGGVDPGRALYIGDVYAIDVLGAASAGMHAALFDPYGQWGPGVRPAGAPDCRALADLAELSTMLD